ncbi:MAG TPA: hypothetical protein VLC55_02620 [Burkholderiales bacterium]|nr:hypothetical protein [Burkholderiales bacterium]
MGQFVPGRDTEVTFTDDAVLDVLVDRANPLKPGKHVFQLVVTDDSGNKSDSAQVTVIVLDKERPTAVIDVLNAQGVLLRPPAEVAFGERFLLSGKRSADIGGVVKAWTWTLLPE